MKINRIICAAIIASTMMFGLQSCFQDMNDDPSFNFPEGAPDPTGEYNREKLKFNFDGDVADSGTYQFLSSPNGKYSFIEGVNGKGLNAEEAYIILDNHPAIEQELAQEIKNLGSFTVAFWVKSSKNAGAISLFSITHKKNFWSNLDVYFDNYDSATEALVKVQVSNFRVEKKNGISKVLKVNIPDVFDNGWVHLAFTYDAETSTIIAYKNGVEAMRETWVGYGRIKFKEVGPMIIGSLPFQVNPSLTSGATAQGWAKWYTGGLDQFHFYNEALSDAEIKSLFSTKE